MTPAENRKNIIFVTKGLGFGGAEQLILSLAKEFRNKKHEVLIVNLDPVRIEMLSIFDSFELEVITVELSLKKIVDTIYKLYKIIRQKKVDVVFAHLPVAGIISRISAFLARTPCVYVEHSQIDKYRPLTRWANYLTYPLSKSIIAVSTSVYNSIELKIPKCVRPQVSLISNGIDTEILEFQAKTPLIVLEKLKKEKLLIGTLASLRPVKRIDLLINSFAQILKKNSSLHLVIAGEGSERQKLENLVIHLKIANAVTFLGEVKKPGSVLGLLDIYVNCSDWEGLSLSILEAMAMGAAVVATRVGGTPEVIREGETGLLIDRNSEEQLSQKLLELIYNPRQRSVLREKGIREIRQYWHIKQRLPLYEKLLFGS